MFTSSTSIVKSSKKQDGERSLLYKLEFFCIESRYKYWLSYLYIFREKEKLSINIIHPIGPHNRSVGIKCRPVPSLFFLWLNGLKYLYFLRDLLTDIMDSTRCVKEQGNLVKEFLSSGNRQFSSNLFIFWYSVGFQFLGLLGHCRYSGNRMVVRVYTVTNSSQKLC